LTRSDIPNVVCIGNSILRQEAYFDHDDAPTKPHVDIQWKWESTAGALAMILNKLGDHATLVTKIQANGPGFMLKQLFRKSRLPVHCVHSAEKTLFFGNCIKGYCFDGGKLIEGGGFARGPELHIDELPLDLLQNADYVILVDEVSPELPDPVGESRPSMPSMDEIQWERFKTHLDAARRVKEAGAKVVLCFVQSVLLRDAPQRLSTQLELIDRIDCLYLPDHVNFFHRDLIGVLKRGLEPLGCSLFYHEWGTSDRMKAHCETALMAYETEWGREGEEYDFQRFSFLCGFVHAQCKGESLEASLDAGCHLAKGHRMVKSWLHDPLE